ncbi:serine hydrolase [uncultured Piscinibacter sp.]|uniref:serine hydrolase domain-containing protein n=1 Tax=uncultured Piscinibacter sp. TaxID=1131835 RepID=UPI00261F0580|nr:serine hydrolase domain-containing protein [uncultured Piscinibacter sp.]
MLRPSRFTIPLLVSLLLFLASCASLQPAAPESVGLSSARLKEVAAIAQEGVDKLEIPGAVVLLARRGKVAYLESFGYRDREANAPMTRDTIFRIASMTKPIVTTAAMILVEEGRLNLSDPVSKYIPEFKDAMVGVEKKDAAGNVTLALEPAQREMTIIDLMRHTSGLTYGQFGKSLVKDRYGAAKVIDPGQTNAEMAAKLARLPLQNQPGTRWDYSMSTDVLGRVIEVVSSMELGQFIDLRILKPLGMADTGFWVSDPAKHGRIAQALSDPATGKRPPLPDRTVKGWQSGGGGMVSTVGDYARFCQMLLGGGELDGTRILSRKSVEQMTRDQLPPGIPTNSFKLPVIDVRQEAGNGFGLGFMVRTAEGRSPVSGSLGDYTWNGFLGTYFWIDPKKEFFGIFLIQTPGTAYVRTAGYWVRLRNAAYQALTD